MFENRKLTWLQNFCEKKRASLLIVTIKLVFTM